MDVLFIFNTYPGKTEATKKCLQYLSFASLQNQHTKHVSRKDIESRDAIEDRVLDTNPLLESFG